MNSQYGKKQVQQSTPKLLQWLFRRFHVSRDIFVGDLLQPAESLLELGSGDGDFCAGNSNKFSRIVGLDISSDRVSRASAKYHHLSCQFLQHDLNEPLPFHDNSFNAVVSLVTLDQVHDLPLCVAEVYRILQPNGTFIFEVSNLGYFVRRVKLLLGIYPHASAFVKSAWPTIGWDAAFCHYFMKKELQRFMEHFEFTVERVTGSGLFYQLRNWWPSLLCGDLIFICKKRV